MSDASTTHTHEWGTQPEMFGPRHETRLGMFLRRTARLEPASRILDAAVGLGQLAGRMTSQGHRVFGIDYSFQAALFAKRAGRASTVVGDLARMPFRDGSFDAVTSGETLEHLDDDEPAVFEIARVLRERGRCFVTVPALEMLRTSSDDYYEHRRRYEKQEMRELFESAGLAIEDLNYWGFPIVLLYDTVFLVPMNKRRAKSDVNDDSALRAIAATGKKRWLVRAVQAVFSIDRLFSWVPFGPGLVLSAEKKSS